MAGTINNCLLVRRRESRRDSSNNVGEDINYTIGIGEEKKHATFATSDSEVTLEHLQHLVHCGISQSGDKVLKKDFANFTQFLFFLEPIQ